MVRASKALVDAAVNVWQRAVNSKVNPFELWGRWATNQNSALRRARRWDAKRVVAVQRAKRNRDQGRNRRARLWRDRALRYKRRRDFLIARARPSNVPRWLAPKYWDAWNRPWAVNASSQQDFLKVLWDNGRLSPNFTRHEARSKDSTRRPVPDQPIPENLRLNAQYHAFKLERVRHDLGDRSMAALSWYRSPSHNSIVGGVSNSQHLNAWGTDWSSQERARLGGTAFDAAMNRHFAQGGRGYQSYVGGPVRHVDDGPDRTWVYA